MKPPTKISKVIAVIIPLLVLFCIVGAYISTQQENRGPKLVVDTYCSNQANFPSYEAWVNAGCND